MDLAGRVAVLVGVLGVQGCVHECVGVVALRGMDSGAGWGKWSWVTENEALKIGRRFHFRRPGIS